MQLHLPYIRSNRARVVVTRDSCDGSGTNHDCAKLLVISVFSIFLFL